MDVVVSHTSIKSSAISRAVLYEHNREADKILESGIMPSLPVLSGESFTNVQQRQKSI